MSATRKKNDRRTATMIPRGLQCPTAPKVLNRSCNEARNIWRQHGLCSAQPKPTMTDSAIACQLKALADDYQRRAEKASHGDAAKASARSTASAEREWRI